MAFPLRFLFMFVFVDLKRAKCLERAISRIVLNFRVVKSIDKFLSSNDFISTKGHGLWLLFGSTSKHIFGLTIRFSWLQSVSLTFVKWLLLIHSSHFFRFDTHEMPSNYDISIPLIRFRSIFSSFML